MHHHLKHTWQPDRGWSMMALAVVTSLLVVAMYVVQPSSAFISVSQSYTADDALPLGSLVSLKKDTADHVIPSLTSNAENLFGVVITEDGSLLTLKNPQGKQVQIATSGTVPVIVSDVNGVIKQNDHITASPIAGVGMKATANVRIIGIAQGDMKVTSEGKQEYTDKDGHKQTVQLGQVPTLVNVSYFFKEPEKSVIPTAIQNVANSLAGRQVSTVPIIISGAIFLVTIIVVMSLIYSMIKSSIISIGRNPMSQAAVYRGIIQLSALVLAILSGGIISIYFVLTKM